MLLYVFILYLDIDFFPAIEKCTGSEGVQNAHSPAEGMWSKNAKACAHHSGILSLSSSGASASLLSFCTLSLSALNAQRKRWLRPDAQQGMTRASEFPGEMFGLVGCSSEGLREGGLWTVLSLQWHLHHEFSAFHFEECFSETFTIFILPQAWEWILLVPSLYTVGNGGSVDIHS